MSRQDRLKVTLDQVGQASVVRFTRRCDLLGEAHLIVHPSTRHKGWQLSRVDQWGPSGHTDLDTFEEAVASAIGAGKIGEDWGNSNYKLNGMEGRR